MMIDLNLWFTCEEMEQYLKDKQYDIAYLKTNSKFYYTFRIHIQNDFKKLILNKNA